jgi:hypothetical protein
MALNAIGRAFPSLAVDSARIAWNRIGTASTYTPDAWSGNTLACAKYAGAATFWIAKARDAGEAAAAKASYAIGISTPGLADDPRARWPSLPDHSHRRRTNHAGHARPIDAGVLTGDRPNPTVSGDDAARDPDNAGASLVAAEAGQPVSEETAPADHCIDVGGRGIIKRDAGDKQHGGYWGTPTFFYVWFPVVPRNNRCLDIDPIQALSL